MKERGDVTFMKEWVKALDDTRILAPADLKSLVSFPRYGRLKLELVLEQISLCRFWALLKGHNYEQIYKGLNSSEKDNAVEEESKDENEG